MADQKTWHNELKEDIERLVAKSSAANAHVLKEGARLLKQAAASDVDINRISAAGRSSLNDAVGAYLKLQIDHASKLIDLGMAVTQNIFSSVGMDSRTSRGGSGAAAPGSAPPPPAFELHVNGAPGDLCQTAFVLESNKSYPITAAFRHSRFTRPDGKGGFDIPVRFAPASVHLSPEHKVRIVIEVPVPPDMPPASYHCVVWVDTCPEMNFTLVCTVTPGKKRRRPPAAKAPSSQRAGKKRSPKKKTARSKRSTR